MNLGCLLLAAEVNVLDFWWVVDGIPMKFTSIEKRKIYTVFICLFYCRDA